MATVGDVDIRLVQTPSGYDVIDMKTDTILYTAESTLFLARILAQLDQRTVSDVSVYSYGFSKQGDEDNTFSGFIPLDGPIDAAYGFTATHTDTSAERTGTFRITVGLPTVSDKSLGTILPNSLIQETALDPLLNYTILSGAEFASIVNNNGPVLIVQLPYTQNTGDYTIDLKARYKNYPTDILSKVTFSYTKPEIEFDLSFNGVDDGYGGYKNNNEAVGVVIQVTPNQYIPGPFRYIITLGNTTLFSSEKAERVESYTIPANTASPNTNSTIRVAVEYDGLSSSKTFTLSREAPVKLLSFTQRIDPNMIIKDIVAKKGTIYYDVEYEGFPTPRIEIWRKWGLQQEERIYSEIPEGSLTVTIASVLTDADVDRTYTYYIKLIKDSDESPIALTGYTGPTEYTFKTSPGIQFFRNSLDSDNFKINIASGDVYYDTSKNLTKYIDFIRLDLELYAYPFEQFRETLVSEIDPRLALQYVNFEFKYRTKNTNGFVTHIRSEIEEVFRTIRLYTNRTPSYNDSYLGPLTAGDTIDIDLSISAKDTTYIAPPIRIQKSFTVVASPFVVEGKEVVAVLGNVTNVADPNNITLPPEVEIIPHNFRTRSLNYTNSSHFTVRNLKLHNNVKLIGLSAFANSDLVSIVDIPPNIEIGDSAFENCSKLEEVLFLSS